MESMGWERHGCFVPESSCCTLSLIADQKCLGEKGTLAPLEWVKVRKAEFHLQIKTLEMFGSRLSPCGLCLQVPMLFPSLAELSLPRGKRFVWFSQQHCLLQTKACKQLTEICSQGTEKMKLGVRACRSADLKKQ